MVVKGYGYSGDGRRRDLYSRGDTACAELPRQLLVCVMLTVTGSRDRETRRRREEK